MPGLKLTAPFYMAMPSSPYEVLSALTHHQMRYPHSAAYFNTLPVCFKEKKHGI